MTPLEKVFYSHRLLSMKGKEERPPKFYICDPNGRSKVVKIIFGSTESRYLIVMMEVNLDFLLDNNIQTSFVLRVIVRICVEL